MTTNTKSVLIIGATGALGLQCLRHFADETSITYIHVLCRNPAKFSDTDKRAYESIITGDARNTNDVEKALAQSKADYIVLATGNGADLRKTDTREKLESLWLKPYPSLPFSM